MSTLAITEAETALGHLERLTEVLRSRGWTVEVAAHDGRLPAALVAGPELAGLNETVIAAPEGAGLAWSYFYGWGERIAPCSEPDAAAATLGRVLAATKD